MFGDRISVPGAKGLLFYIYDPVWFRRQGISFVVLEWNEFGVLFCPFPEVCCLDGIKDESAVFFWFGWQLIFCYPAVDDRDIAAKDVGKGLCVNAVSLIGVQAEGYGFMPDGLGGAGQLFGNLGSACLFVFLDKIVDFGFCPVLSVYRFCQSLSFCLMLDTGGASVKFLA